MKNKFVSILIIFTIYLSMFLSYFLLDKWLTISDIFVKLFVIDVIWTIYVWVFGLIFKNSSVYDPYWSVVPIFLILIYLLKVQEINYQTYLLVVTMLFWGLRLTINWGINFKNLKKEDWRYQHYRSKYPKWWFLLNLFGINLMPTIMVYLGLIPVFYYIELSTVVNINLSTIIGLLVTAFGVIIELVADNQMLKFKKKTKNPLAINREGLWKRSRHPNYLGEIMVWWGAFLMMLSLDEKKFLLLLGPLLITLLFLFISIPLMEKRQLQNKASYQEYIDTTNMLLIFPVHK